MRRKSLSFHTTFSTSETPSTTTCLQVRARRDSGALSCGATSPDTYTVVFARVGGQVLPQESRPFNLLVDDGLIHLQCSRLQISSPFSLTLKPSSIYRLWHCFTPHRTFLVFDYRATLSDLPAKYWKPNSKHFEPRSISLELDGLSESQFNLLKNALQDLRLKSKVCALSHTQLCFKSMEEDAFLQGLRDGTLPKFAEGNARVDSVDLDSDDLEMAVNSRRHSLPPTLVRQRTTAPRRKGQRQAKANVMSVSAPARAPVPEEKVVHEVPEDSQCDMSANDANISLDTPFRLDLDGPSSSAASLPRLSCRKVSLDGIDITQTDLDRCQPGEFLNDNIIDFYLAFVSRRFVTPLLKSVFLFNTHFFRLLERDPESCAQRWQRKERILDKKFVFIPVNEHAHWWLLLLCNTTGAAKAPGSPPPDGKRKRKRLLPTEETEARRKQKLAADGNTGSPVSPKPLSFWEGWQMFVLDSMSASVPLEALRLVRKFLAHRFAIESPGLGGAPPASDEVERQIDSVPVKTMNTPQQSNFSDCGVYVLHYVELFCSQNFLQDFLQDPDAQLQKEDWFVAEDIVAKRRFIIDLVLDWDRRQGSSSLAPNKRPRAIDDGADFFARRQEEAVQANGAVVGGPLAPTPAAQHVSRSTRGRPRTDPVVVSSIDDGPTPARPPPAAAADAPAPGGDSDVEPITPNRVRRLPAAPKPRRRGKVPFPPPPPPPKPPTAARPKPAAQTSADKPAAVMVVDP